MESDVLGTVGGCSLHNGSYYIQEIYNVICKNNSTHKEFIDLSVALNLSVALKLHFIFCECFIINIHFRIIGDSVKDVYKRQA